MAYRSRSKMGVNILQFDGDLSAFEMVKMKSRVKRLLRKKHKKLLFDLSRTRHVELAGIGILVDRLRSVRAEKGDIKLCNLHPQVEKELKMIGVGNLMESFNTEDEAIRSFAA
ncbi:MAG TPA: STAS domain-containing protein [bacterium]|nr:STAS domain-containing protein [bacterium]